MNEAQASRLLDLGVEFVARYDASGTPVAAWYRGEPSFHLWASDKAAAQAAGWGPGPGGQLARQVAMESMVGILTILVPLPAGGFIVGAVERSALTQLAGTLADDFEAAVVREFGATWAPVVAAGVVFATFLLLAGPRNARWGRE